MLKLTLLLGALSLVNGCKGPIEIKMTADNQYDVKEYKYYKLQDESKIVGSDLYGWFENLIQTNGSYRGTKCHKLKCPNCGEWFSLKTYTRGPEYKRNTFDWYQTCLVLDHPEPNTATGRRLMHLLREDRS